MPTQHRGGRVVSLGSHTRSQPREDSDLPTAGGRAAARTSVPAEPARSVAATCRRETAGIVVRGAGRRARERRRNRAACRRKRAASGTIACLTWRAATAATGCKSRGAATRHIRRTTSRSAQRCSSTVDSFELTRDRVVDRCHMGSCSRIQMGAHPRGLSRICQEPVLSQVSVLIVSRMSGA